MIRNKPSFLNASVLLFCSKVCVLLLLLELVAEGAPVSSISVAGINAQLLAAPEYENGNKYKNNTSFSNFAIRILMHLFCKFKFFLL
jgi:hypothetical protein